MGTSGNNPTTSLRAGETVVCLEGLTRHFADVHAVDELSFTFGGGDLFGFIGPNGAGKTTTMRILATLDLPTRGNASINGVSVVDYPDRVHHLIGYMPDRYGVYSNTNVEEYLDFFARSYRLRGRACREAVQGVMAFTGLEGLKTKQCEALSKGMRQRLSLARALIHNPKVLILDEPAEGLDPRARIELRELLCELARQGKAVLISSHILQELSEICNRVAIIEQGRLMASGPIAEIQKKLEVREMISVRFLEGTERALRFLSEQPGVSDPHEEADRIVFGFSGDEEQRAQLLAQLVSAGLKVTEFSGKRYDLEDVFMAVTKGKVQ